MKRVPLPARGAFGHGDTKIHITIDAPPNGDYTQAIDAVLANGLAAITPLLPDYWQDYATKTFLSGKAPDASPAPATSPKPLRITGHNGVTPPHLLHSVAPDFSPTARALKYAGNVLIQLWVTPDGKPSHLSIVSPAGAGLDEKALAAVSQYTFSPAMQDGKPVLVELKVKVNFQIF